jgi:DMSO/TMAO reductase YedYZ molybdopterin-dependent catalytic subunit
LNSWNLVIEGEVNQSLTLTMNEIRQVSETSQVVTS